MTCDGAGLIARAGENRSRVGIRSEQRARWLQAGSALRPGRLIGAPGVEAVNGRGPSKLLEGRDALAREEPSLRRFIGRDLKRATQDVRAVDHDEDRESRTHPRREETVETDLEAGLLLRLADRGLLRRLVRFDQPS